MSFVSQAPEQRFSNRVADYVRYRPSYPERIIGLLQREAGLRPESVIADVGSGTGISAAMFLRFGCAVFGVEPNREMREAAERLLAGHFSFRSVNGTAEATTLPEHSVDIVIAAQAFHWFNGFEARKEFNRILKQSGHVVLIWNERRLDATPFLRDYEQMLLRFATDYAKVRHENIGADELRQFFINGDYTAHAMPNEQRFDFEGLKGRLLSSSYAPAEGQPGHEAMIEELTRIYQKHETERRVCFEYDAKIYIGR